MPFKSIMDVVRFSGEKMTKANLFETERMFCDVYGFEPGQEQKIHAHQGADKVYVVLEGRGTFRIGAEEREAGIATVVLAPSGVEHGVRNTGKERLMLLVFMTPNPNMADRKPYY
jgi:mannose-6-phosphate isomerase-like protein (cupin superfamily)